MNVGPERVNSPAPSLGKVGERRDRCGHQGRALTGGVFPSATLVVPTFREMLNLRPLLERIEAVREEHQLALDVLFMDDDSRDGSVDAVAAFDRAWVNIVVRQGRRGLSAAVVEGIERARGDAIVIMDADLSHPPEKIPELLAALESHSAAIGSRYALGGSTDAAWGMYRWLNSRGAVLLARPLTRVSDPMAGFFAFRRADVPDTALLKPIGYKIALELIVRCGFDDIAEIPIHFTERVLGESKLTVKQQLLYLIHLRRLYAYKLGWR